MAAHKMFIVGEAGSSPPGHEVTATILGQSQISTQRGGRDMFYYENSLAEKTNPSIGVRPTNICYF